MRTQKRHSQPSSVVAEPATHVGNSFDVQTYTDTPNHLDHTLTYTRRPNPKPSLYWQSRKLTQSPSVVLRASTSNSLETRSSSYPSSRLVGNVAFPSRI